MRGRRAARVGSVLVCLASATLVYCRPLASGYLWIRLCYQATA